MSARYEIQARALAEQGRSLEFEFVISQMPRLAGLLSSETEKVKAEFSFFQDEFGDKLKLKAKAQVKGLCHRCNSPMGLELTVDNEVLLLDSENELKKLGDDIDAIVAPVSLSLKDALEDELILAMPMVPKHELAECAAAKFVGKETAEGKQRPFAELGKNWSNLNGSTTES